MIRYNTFSSALWNQLSDGPACTFTASADGSVACTVTNIVQGALDNKLRSAQFRVRFEKAGDGDGNPDLALFYNTESNKNESGIFQLEVVVENASADKSDATNGAYKSRDVSFFERLLTVDDSSSLDNDIYVPVVLNIVKGSGQVSTARDKDNVLALFQKSQAVWNQARIIFDVKLEEITLDGDTQKAVEQQDLKKLYAAIPTNDRALHIVFVQTLGGPNGIAIAPSLALVADSTTVNDFRATAHEIGHLLGLSHTNANQERLLYRGVNGTILTPEEINLARRQAKVFKSSGM